MNIWPILALAGGMMIILLIFEAKDHVPGKTAAKACLSSLFTAVAVVWSGGLQTGYSVTITIGLTLGLVGDVCLAQSGRGWFKIGLYAFLTGHLAYLAAFIGQAPRSAWLSPWSLLFPALSGLIYLWLRPHIREASGPVIAYLAVITAMTIAAMAAAARPDLPPAPARFIALGAGAFYLSDLFVARQRFVQPGLINRFLGLPLYYLGQYLIAFSTSGV